jgi:hypothetical protein
VLPGSVTNGSSCGRSELWGEGREDNLGLRLQLVESRTVIPRRMIVRKRLSEIPRLCDTRSAFRSISQIATNFQAGISSVV